MGLRSSDWLSGALFLALGFEMVGLIFYFLRNYPTAWLKMALLAAYLVAIILAVLQVVPE
jgi:hypothetical protein